MILETSVDRIKILADAKDDENMSFRSYLKCNVDVEVLDEAIHRTLSEIQPQIDCTLCANCCRAIGPCVNAADIARLTQALHIAPDKFSEDYLLADEIATHPLPAVLPELPVQPTALAAEPAADDCRDDECEQKWGFREKPCPLLVGNLCSCYDHRPECCRSYPHLHKNGRMWSLLRIVEDVSVCPIVYNVYERLKEELWEDRSRSIDTIAWDLGKDDDAACYACDQIGPVDDLGLCASCGAKLDRDMIRDRDWARSVSAFGISESEWENLRTRVIARYGQNHELIAPGLNSRNRAATRDKRCGGKGRNSGRKKRRQK
jgi:uncharacterized protein